MGDFLRLASRFAWGQQLLQLPGLLGELLENPVHVGPVEAHVGGAARKLMRLQQRRQAARNGVEDGRLGGLAAGCASLAPLVG